MCGIRAPGSSSASRRLGQGVSRIAIGPEGKRAALAGPNTPLFGMGDRRFGYAAALDLASSKLSTWAIQHDDVLKALEISPSGTLAVSGSLDRSALLWRMEDGEQLRRLNHGSGVAAVAFSPDGRLLVTGTEEGAVRVWNGMTGTPLSEETWLEANVSSLRFHPDGCEFLAATDSALYRFSAASTEAGTACPGNGRAAHAGPHDSRAPLVASCSFGVTIGLKYGTPVDCKQICEFLVGNKTAAIETRRSGPISGPHRRRRYSPGVGRSDRPTRHLTSEAQSDDSARRIQP